MTYPTPKQREAMRAFLGGWIVERQLTSITLDEAKAVIAKVTAPGVTVDGMIVSRILRRLDFQRSHRPEDTGTIIYRRVN